MGFEDKILSREISQIIWEKGCTLGTAESCTGGRIAESIIAMPGASNYFKGSIISYTDEIKEKVLGIDPKIIEEKNAVSEEVAIEMVKGAIKVLNVDYAISATGFAGPGGGTDSIPVGTIWLACGTADDIETMKIEKDYGRDINLAAATSKALQMFLQYLLDRNEDTNKDSGEPTVIFGK